jgi:hypothetical protein
LPTLPPCQSFLPQRSYASHKGGLDLFTPGQLDAIEHRYPTREVRALVAEVRRLNAIVECAGDLVRALEPARFTPPPKLMLVALVERLETPATRRRKSG